MSVAFSIRTRLVQAHGVVWRHTVFGSGHEEFEPVDSDGVLVERAGTRKWTITRFRHRDGAGDVREAIGAEPPLKAAARTLQTVIKEGISL